MPQEAQGPNKMNQWHWHSPWEQCRDLELGGQNIDMWIVLFLLQRHHVCCQHWWQHWQKQHWLQAAELGSRDGNAQQRSSSQSSQWNFQWQPLGGSFPRQWDSGPHQQCHLAFGAKRELMLRCKLFATDVVVVQQHSKCKHCPMGQCSTCATLSCSCSCWSVSNGVTKQ